MQKNWKGSLWGLSSKRAVGNTRQPCQRTQPVAIRRECGDRVQTDRKYATHCQTASISLNFLHTFIFKTSSVDTICRPLLQPRQQHTNIDDDAKPLMSNEGAKGSFQLVSLVPMRPA